MKKTFLLVSMSLLSLFVAAQGVDNVTLVVSGDGATKEEATHVALRSAIEQAYGVFVSANTEILNDELVRDEIATVTSGNVKSFKELSAAVLPNGNQTVTLQAVVSTKKLAAYAQSKGASCEFAGAVFGANLKMIDLNKKNTSIAFENLLKQCKELAPYIFEPRLTIGNPTGDGVVPIKIEIFSTSNTADFCELIFSTMQALRMSEEERKQLDEMNIRTYGVSAKPVTKISETEWNTERSYTDYGGYYYSPFPYQQFIEIIASQLSEYYLVDNFENTYYFYDWKECRDYRHYYAVMVNRGSRDEISQDEYKKGILTILNSEYEKAGHEYCNTYNVINSYVGTHDVDHYNGSSKTCFEFAESSDCGVRMPLSYLRTPENIVSEKKEEDLGSMLSSIFSGGKKKNDKKDKAPTPAYSKCLGSSEFHIQIPVDVLTRITKIEIKK